MTENRNEDIEAKEIQSERATTSQIERNSSVQKQHWALAFIAGMIASSLLAITAAGVYLFYFETKFEHLVQFQEQYFEQKFTSFSNKLFNQLNENLTKKFESNFDQIENNFQIRLAERQEKLSKNLIEQFAQAEKEIQSNLHQLGDSLTTNIPITIRSKLLEDRKAEITSAIKGVEMAENFLTQGNPAKATLFFINALNKDPGNISILTRYISSVLGWARKQSGEGNLTISQDVIEETNRFLQNQAGNVAPQDISKLEELIAACDQVGKEIQDKIILGQQVLSLDQGKELLSKVEKILALPIPKEEHLLNQYLTEIQTVQNAIETIPDTNTVISDELKKSIHSKAKTVETDLNVLTILQLLEKKETLEDRGLQSNPNGNETYKITTLNSMAQQLTILQSTASPEISKKIDAAFEKISTQILEIDRQQAKTAWEKILKESEKFKNYMTVTEGILWKDARQALITLQRFIAANSERISNQEYLEKISALAENVQKAISEWDKAQGLRYDSWALNKLESFNLRSKNDRGFFSSDKDRLYKALLNDLGLIDSRFLSPSAARVYNEVFELNYKELNDDQKIKLSSEMARSEKADPQAF